MMALGNQRLQRPRHRYDVICDTAEEYAATLRNIADGKIAVAPLITGRIPPDGLAEAFSALASPEMHAKIVVEFGR